MQIIRRNANKRVVHNLWISISWVKFSCSAFLRKRIGCHLIIDQFQRLWGSVTYLFSEFPKSHSRTERQCLGFLLIQLISSTRLLREFMFCKNKIWCEVEFLYEYEFKLLTNWINGNYFLTVKFKTSIQLYIIQQQRPVLLMPFTVFTILLMLKWCTEATFRSVVDAGHYLSVPIIDLS